MKPVRYEMSVGDLPPQTHTGKHTQRFTQTKMGLVTILLITLNTENMKITIEDLDGTKYTAEISNPHITEVVHALRSLLIGYTFGIKTLDKYIPDPDQERFVIDGDLLEEISYVLNSAVNDLEAWIGTYARSELTDKLIREINEVLQKLEEHE
jgi:hypothetical protein